MGDPNLVTTCTFHGQEFLFKMNVLNNNLEILVTDKNTGEEWQCSYDATYIENLTQKTGNFKQFDIFVAMIKSGLLRTSESVSLDLLTFEDLELLRSRKITKSVGPANSNRRYLILTYVVEFDKIRYPLPLEYCGPPDPVILQSTIRRLEVELAKTKEELTLRTNNGEARKMYFLQRRVEELTEENTQLHEELRQLAVCFEKKPKNQVLQLQRAVSNLERSVVMERNSHHELVEKLRRDKVELTKQLEKVRCSERSLKSKLNKALSQASRIGTGDHPRHRTPENKLSSQSVRTMFKRTTSPGLPEINHLRRSGGSSREDIPRKKSKDRYCTAQSRPTSSASKRVLSRTSSSSSANKYLDPEAEYVSSSRTETPPCLTPRISRTKSAAMAKSRCSSANSSRASSRASSRKSRTTRNKHLDYKRLEEKIEHLQKMLKHNLRRDS